jgi:hypothetical protein
MSDKTMIVKDELLEWLVLRVGLILELLNNLSPLDGDTHSIYTEFLRGELLAYKSISAYINNREEDKR